MHFGSPAEIFGVDGIIILVVVVLVLFGSTQIPKMARSLGSAQKEFKKGLEEGATEDGKTTVVVQQPAPTVVAPPAAVAPPPQPAPPVVVNPAPQSTVTVETQGDGSPPATS